MTTGSNARVCSFVDPSSGAQEQLSYLDVGDASGQLHVVHHRARGEPRGGLVLCGPIGAERERSYRTLVDIARAVAADGFDALRFDYRGMGESTGNFEDYCLSDWRRDVETCIPLIRERLSDRPLGLWGVRAGALLASEVFATGVGAGVMLCAATDGQAHLMDILRRSLVADMLARPGKRRSTRDEIVAAMERGEVVNVDGYPWSKRLWQDAASHGVVIPADDRRPWRVVDFAGLPQTAVGSRHEARRQINSDGRFWESGRTLVPTIPSLAASTIAWLTSLQPGEVV